MKILSAKQIRALDAYTIDNEPITSLNLMERASKTFADWFIEKFPTGHYNIHIFCGPGNNGGDGLAIARLLYVNGYNTIVHTCEISFKKSADYLSNLVRLPKYSDGATPIQVGDKFPEIKKSDLIIDAIFGSGINRPVDGYWGELISYINETPNEIISVDIPSGLFADKLTEGNTIHANYTFSFELPKLAFLFPSNQYRLGQWEVASINLSQEGLEKLPTNHFFIDKNFVRIFIKRRNKFDHKGTFGHALLICGSYGKIGAAILAARAALKSGVGLLSIHAPRCAYTILQTAVPEAMIHVDEDEFYFSDFLENDFLEKYKAIGIGCGLNTKSKSVKALSEFLSSKNKPLVLDADALNIISQNKNLFDLIPSNSILTPHPKEFERLFGKTENDMERFELQKGLSQKHHLFILLKGANTCITSPDGNAYFNSTGNPGMATGGSGDVLTGIITSLLAQGYNSLEASTLGAFIHGLSGDIALENFCSEESMIAGDLVEHLGKAFKEIKK